MTKETEILTSGALQIERQVTRRDRIERYASFHVIEPERDSWYACSARVEGEFSGISLPDVEEFSVQKAFAVGVAISMAIDWIAEEMEG